MVAGWDGLAGLVQLGWLDAWAMRLGDAGVFADFRGFSDFFQKGSMSNTIKDYQPTTTDEYIMNIK